MKKIAIIIILFSVTILYSQSYTEKYNSINNRYEYYDSSGYMIGYKQWSSINNQWEYYNTKNSRRETDYGEYVQPINLGLANKVLSSKQNSYDRNVTLVSNHMEQIKANLFNYFSYDKNKRSAVVERWDSTIQNVWSSNINFSSNSQTQKMISALNTLYYEYIDDIENTVQPNEGYNSSSGYSRNLPLSKTPYEVKSSYDKVVNRDANNSAPSNYKFKCRLTHNLSASIKKKPSYKSKTLFEVYNTNIIYVIKESVSQNKSYDRVYANGRYGYIYSYELDKENNVFTKKENTSDFKTNKTFSTTLKFEGKLRDKPYPDASIIKDIPSGASVKLLSYNDAYYKVSYKNQEGYMYESYLVETHDMLTMKN